MNVLKITVSGRVQGVGFRYFVYRLASRMNITGTVRNLSNGHVEIVCKTENLDQFIASLKKGNGFSRIDHLDVELIEEASVDQHLFHHFEILS